MRKIIFFLLSNPALFNSVRKIIAGNQKNTKDFVKITLENYNAKSVLDVGCGTGDFVDAIPQKTSYLGIDIDPKFISYARRNYEKEKRDFLVGDINNNELLKNKTFDAALLISTLHHLSDFELEKILPLIKRHTKKVIIVADIIPNPDNLLRELMVKLDRGSYVRRREEKIKILKKYFKIVNTKVIKSRLAVQFGIICEK